MCGRGWFEGWSLAGGGHPIEFLAFHLDWGVVDG